MNIIDNDKFKNLEFEETVLRVLREKNKDLHIFYGDNSYGQTYTTWDGFIANQLDLSCFGKGIVSANYIYILFKDLDLDELDDMAILDWLKNIYNIENTCLVLITKMKGNKISFDARNFKGNIVIISYYDLIKNEVINKILNHFKDYLIEKNQKVIDDNKKSLMELDGNISFALGAGCSKNSHISDWNELSKSLGFDLLFTLVDDNDSTYKNMVVTNNFNEQLFEDYDKNSALDVIYQSYVDDRSDERLLNYYCSIKKALYMSYDSPNDSNNDLLTAINKCIKRKNVKEVINYNFDSVLEQNYDNYYKSKPDEVLNAKTQIGGCVVHHVHGYIPFDYDAKTKVKDFIFTDRDYYDVIKNNDHECNEVQRQILSTYNTIFVGVSFTDGNLKDILRDRLSKNEKPDNEIFGFLKVPSFEGKGKEIEMMENIYKIILQNYFTSLGVKILWVKEYDEIPKMIDLIK